MAYVSGTLNQNAKVIVLDSSNKTVAAGTKNSGGFTLDRFGDTIRYFAADPTESGTLIAVSDIGETIAYNKVAFIKQYDLPTVPWTETFTMSPSGETYATGHMWTRNYGSPNIYLNNDKLRFDNTGLPNGAVLSNRSDFLIWGNFDIQTDLDIITGPNTNTWVAQMQVRYEPTGDASSLADFFNVLRFYTSNTHSIKVSYRLNGTAFEGTSVNTTITSTKFRIVRQNNLITGYYWNGSAWATLSSNIDFGSAYPGGHAPISVSLLTYNAGSFPIVIADFDNFTINAGYINYKYSEAFNGYSDDSLPDSNFFENTQGLVSINGNKLRLGTNSGTSSSRTTFKQYLKGNFDTVVLLNMVDAPSSGNWHVLFNFWIDNNNTVNIKRTYNGSTHSIMATSYVGNVAASNTFSGATNTVIFRVRRLLTTLDVYYSTNYSTWTLLHTRTSFSTNDARIIFQNFYISGTPTVTADFDNFKIVNKPLNDLKIKYPIDTVI